MHISCLICPSCRIYASGNWVSIGSGNGLSPSHYLNQCWLIVNWTLRNKLQWNSSRNTKFFIHENAFENVVCEMVAILSRWVKKDATGELWDSYCVWFGEDLSWLRYYLFIMTSVAHSYWIHRWAYMWKDFSMFSAKLRVVYNFDNHSSPSSNTHILDTLQQNMLWTLLNECVNI